MNKIPSHKNLILAAELTKKLEDIQIQIEQLLSGNANAEGLASGDTIVHTRGGGTRIMTQEQKDRISAAQKARWAKERASQGAAPVQAGAEATPTAAVATEAIPPVAATPTVEAAAPAPIPPVAAAVPPVAPAPVTPAPVVPTPAQPAKSEKGKTKSTKPALVAA